MALTDMKNKLKKLPDCPGAYLFYDKNKKLIYVGKATSLKSRVRSYFAGLRSPRPIELMIHQVADIKYQIADSALEAAILESNLIKKNRPKYNVFWKDDKSWNYFLLTREDFPRLITMREHEVKQLSEADKKKYRNIFGPYPGLNIKEATKILRRMFHISFCRPDAKRACIYREMGECLGVCTGEISARDYRAKVMAPLAMFLAGKKQRLIKQIEKQMKLSAKADNFEEAARLRDQLKSLHRVRDVALINESFVKEKIGVPAPLRIEAYDISNLGASGRVGSMIVFDASGPVKNEYKKFNIKTVSGQNDVACLAEILSRRMKHDDWPAPDVWLIDGGRPQVNRAVKISAGRVPIIIGIAKGPDRKKNEFIVGTRNSVTASFLDKNQGLLIRARDEAHRFAIVFQKTKRKLNFL
jgi:excinuclease ABC subunit C